MEDRTGSKMMTLKSNDGEEFLVPEAVAMQSQVISLLFEDCCTKDPIPLLNVSAKILAKVIEYCKHQIDVDQETANILASSEHSKKMKNQGNWKMNQCKLSDWEEKFFDVDQETVFALVMAADYLYIDKLLESACQKVADTISGKTVEEIRETLRIENDFSPEEEEEICREYPAYGEEI